MTEEVEEEGPDPFIAKVQKKMEFFLDLGTLEAKDANALFANCIKFLMVKHRIKGMSADDGDYFSEGS